MNTSTEEAFNKEISSLTPCKRAKLSINQDHSISTGSYNLKEERIMCVGRNVSGNISKFASLHMDVKEKNSFLKKEFQIKQI